MTMIDSAIEDVAGRFGLGPKSGQLMQELVHLITGSPGGVNGFIDKFRSAGLGSEVTSWLGRTDGAALAGAQVERALGSTALGGIASRLGLGSGVVATAIGYILPKLIGQITPGGSSHRGGAGGNTVGAGAAATIVCASMMSQPTEHRGIFAASRSRRPSRICCG
jgi:uncharacterized protein YidB (DUF937 family)